MGPIELRPLRPDDLGAICDLVNRSDVHDGVPRVLTLAELEEELDRPDMTLADDTRLALRGDELAGFAWVWNRPVEVGSLLGEAGLERAYLRGSVDPQHRFQAVGTTLLSWSRDRAEERLRSRTHSLPKFIRVDAYDWMEANHRLYARLGFTPVRWFEELIRPLTDLPATPLPAGVNLLPWPDDRDEETLAARNHAFADHWGSTPVNTQDWKATMRGHGARPDLSVIAVDAATGEIVGLCMNSSYPEDDELTGRREAWIETLATLKAQRRQGLASVMIASSLAAFSAEGFTHAALGVDADSITGAARLYRNLGFEPLRRSITHQIEVI